ncbi:GIN domain-containing protein [Comamonas testosteroni]|jgi:hypothetical protein|uniref:GIN domain-containing protein n=1 Tax=Comamonas testosteroni TaxID=285 RepID=UPI0026EF27AD|nr:DUF2807 domain-containing protein [Comamonas testosteroni]
MTLQREPRPIQAIKELRIRGSADVFVKRGEPLMTVIAEKPEDEIELEITGSGTIRASGEVIRLNVDISGSGDVKAKELLASIAELRVSGSGDIKAQATQSLSARVSGSGDIKVWGNPAKRDTRVSGSGEIKFK